MLSWSRYFTSLLALLSGTTKRRRERTIYRLSSGGMSVSAAVKEHNANMRFKTREAAARNRAHPLDLSAVVPLKVSVGEYRRLFKRRHIDVVDLRQMRDVKATRLRVRP